MAFVGYLLVFLSCIYLCLAIELSGSVTWNKVCPNIRALGQSKIILDSGKLGGSVTRDGSFVIHDVPVGTYILSVIAHDYTFDQLRIDVVNSSEIPEVRPYVAGTPLDPPSTILLQYPISLTPRTKSVYFIPPESFNLVGMLSNPMMLLMVFGGVMMLAMPYLMKNMDPEALEDLKEQQAKIAGIQSSMAGGDFRSGFSALMSAADDSVAQQQAPVKAAPVSKGKSGKKAKR